jgi:O-antigen/teichoic acid export membrane protein
LRYGARVVEGVKRWTGLDRAISYSLIGRGWSALQGVTTIFLIARYLSRAEQGYYYTFASLAAAQIIFELGFSFVILQFAAHERVNLVMISDGSFEPGSDSYTRLASVLKQAVRWYSVASIVMGSTLAIVGMWFFSHEGTPYHVEWRWPWIFVVVLTAITFEMDPVISFLEGCGRVVEVGRLRVQQAVLGSVLAWGALLSHHGLYAPGFLILGEAIFSLRFLYLHRRCTWPLLRSPKGTAVVKWSTEIWPFQWRIAVSWICSYCILQVMNPILFALVGPVAAGQMGMSINICNALGSVALAWVTTKAAPFGALIARKQFAELDRIFFRALLQSAGLLAVLSVVLSIAVRVVIALRPAIAARIIPFPLFVLLLFTINCSNIVISQAYYLRAHKREPFLFFWVLIAVVAVGSMTVLAPRYGLTGVTIAYAVTAGLFRVLSGTWVFLRKRKQWHRPDGDNAEATVAIR